MSAEPVADGQPLPVYLVHFGAPDWVSDAVDTLLLSDVPVDVHVMDNGPTGALLELDPRVTIERMSGNLGYAGAANVALRHWLSGTAPFCVIGSHDLHVEGDCLSKLLAAARDEPTFGILAPVVPTNFRGSMTTTAGAIELTSWVSGTCMLLRRECIEEVGLFDPVFHSYCEDNELCARARKHGWLIGTLTTAHARGLGTRHQDDRWMNKQKNRLLLAWRVGGIRDVVLEYRKCFRVLGYALLRKRESLPGAIAGLTIGTARLARGMMSPPGN